jgi:response regulator RpfG family c-di-GMP phosphodiesterase
MKKPRILLVDDEPLALDAFRRALRPQRDRWNVVCLDAAQTALQQLLDEDYDVVVTDVKMPGMSGLELLERIQENERTRNVPVIMVTGVDERELKKKALELGAADLVTKPVDIDQLVARLENALRVKSYQDDLRETNERLLAEVGHDKIELRRARLNLVFRLAKAAEEHDESTGNHTLRVAYFSRAVAAALGCDRVFQETLLLTSPLHDIGKIGIPDSILTKKGRLTPAERAVVETHCEIGARILREPSRITTSRIQQYPIVSVIEELTDPMLEAAATIALCHHEKWDGTGYPRKLAGLAIPREARIVAIADVFDALTSRRPYKPAYSEDVAVQMVLEERGCHFDPEVCDAFMNALPEIRNIRKSLADDQDALNMEQGSGA